MATTTKDKHYALVALAVAVVAFLIYMFWRLSGNVSQAATSSPGEQNVPDGSNIATGGPGIPAAPFQYMGPNAPNSSFVFGGPSSTTTYDGLNNYTPPGGSTQYLTINVPANGRNQALPPRPPVSSGKGSGCGCGGCSGGTQVSPCGSCNGSTTLYPSVASQIAAEGSGPTAQTLYGLRTQSAPNYNVSVFPYGAPDTSYAA